MKAVVPVEAEPRRLVESAEARGRYVHVVTYHDGPGAPVRAQLLFRTAEDAAECARALTAAVRPPRAPAR